MKKFKDYINEATKYEGDPKKVTTKTKFHPDVLFDAFDRAAMQYRDDDVSILVMDMAGSVLEFNDTHKSLDELKSHFDKEFGGRLLDIKMDVLYKKVMNLIKMGIKKGWEVHGVK